MLKSIIFDFDGVLCESVDIKTESFRRLFVDYPEHLKNIIKLHEENGKTDVNIRPGALSQIIYREY